MKIMFVNNDGGGFADSVDVQAGTTMLQFFEERMSGKRAANFTIRVNRGEVEGGYQLQEGDRVSITANKIEGALGVQ